MALRAYHRLILPDGTVHKMVVCHFDDTTGRLLDFHPLTAEEPFVEWVGGTKLTDEEGTKVCGI